MRANLNTKYIQAKLSKYYGLKWAIDTMNTGWDHFNKWKIFCFLVEGGYLYSVITQSATFLLWVLAVWLLSYFVRSTFPFMTTITS